MVEPAGGGAKRAQDEEVREILDGPLPVEMRSFGDWSTLFAVLQLSAKIAGPAPEPIGKMKDVLDLLGSNFLDLKEKIQGKPGRRELRDRLRSISDQARRLLNDLEDFDILSKLVAAERADRGTCRAADVIARRRTLAELVRIAASAAARIPKGKGTKRGEGNDSSAQELCAIMVRRAWYAAQGEWPGPQSIPAWEACEALWIAAGGPASKEKDSAPGRWRRHLENAERPRAQGSNGMAFMRDVNGRTAFAEVTIPSGSSTPKA